MNLRRRQNNTYREQCNPKGYPKDNNLTEQEQEGLKELTELTKSKEKVVTVTDKSDRLCLNTTDSLQAMAAPHIEQNTIINDQETRTNEKILKAFSFQFARLLKVCRFLDNDQYQPGTTEA